MMVPHFPLRRLALAVAASLAVPALADTTLPTGGQVAAGSASIGSAGSAMTVQQSSQRAVIRWDSFSIGREASVTFEQPNSAAIALNRVIGNDLSRIDGQLNANGQVFISNPNGVLFGAGSQVNVGGLVASTLDMHEGDFMAGSQVLLGNSAASVINEGSLNGRNIALVGARVINIGDITADSAVLAAGERVTLGFDGNGLLTASVDSKALLGLVHNGGVIDVGNGRLLMTAGAAQALGLSVVNNSGVVQARSLGGEGGEIVLSGDAVANTGTLDAGTDGGIALDGNVVVSPASSMTGVVTVTAAIAVDPDNPDSAALADQVQAYAEAHLPALVALMDSAAIDLPLLVSTLNGMDLAAFLGGAMTEAELAQAFNALLGSGAIDLASLAATFDGPRLAGLLGPLPMNNPWLQTAVQLLAADAVDMPALLAAVNGELLARLLAGNFAMADAVGLLASLVGSGAINANAVVGALTPDQQTQLIGQWLGPDLAPLAGQLISSGALDLNKAAAALSPAQWQALLDGSANPVSLFTALIAGGAINLNTPAGQSLLTSLFGGRSPVATAPPPAPKPAKLTFQQRMKQMMAKIKARMQAMREKRKRA